jgi:hypothetical protein
MERLPTPVSSAAAFPPAPRDALLCGLLGHDLVQDCPVAVRGRSEKPAQPVGELPLGAPARQEHAHVAGGDVDALVEAESYNTSAVEWCFTRVLQKLKYY